MSPNPFPAGSDDALPEHWRFADAQPETATRPRPASPQECMFPSEGDRKNCSVCGKSLGDNKIEICWTPAKSFHVRCHDWREASFPVALVKDLRQLYRALGHLRPQVAKTGAVLAQLEAKWPTGGADTVLAARRVRNELRAVIERLQIMRRLYNITD